MKLQGTNPLDDIQFVWGMIKQCVEGISLCR